MMAEPHNLQDKIQRRTDDVRRSGAKLRLYDDGYEVFLSGAAEHCAVIAGSYLELDEIETARGWFAWAIASAVESAPDIAADPDHDFSGALTTVTRLAIGSALLIGQPELRERAIETIVNLDEAYVNENWNDPTFYPPKILAFLAEGEDDRATEYVDRLEEARSHYDADDARNLYLGYLARVARGILDGDDAAIEDNVRNALEYRLDVADSWSVGLGEVMDVYCAAFLVLARDRGLTVEVDHEYIPDELVDDVAPIE